MNMHKLKLIACVVAVLFGIWPLRAAEMKPLLPTAETPAQRNSRLAWSRKARFGLFIHWGPSSLSGKEISWARIGHPHDFRGNESVPPQEYDNLYKRFNPVKFDADAWMRLAKEAGMKYVVFVTKHHDGFSMWPTKLRPDYSIAATPFRRDICREIAAAAHRQGLKLGWYYSTRDWTHPDYLVGDNRKYDAFYRGQVRELLSNYGRVDLLWFDHVAGNWRDYRFRELFEMIYRLQPGILVNNRAAAFFQPTNDQPAPGLGPLVGGDFDTPEQRIGHFQDDRPWESCMTITDCVGGGGWSYRPDGRTRHFEECLRMLVSCATGDGNLLLNVGPLPTGEIAADQQDVLRQMGRWLAKYGASIYATRGGPLRNGDWGGTTFRDKTIYLHILKWSGDRLHLPPLRAKVVIVMALTGGSPALEQTAAGVTIVLPPDQQDKIDTVVKLELDAPAAGEFLHGRPLDVAQPVVLRLDEPRDYKSSSGKRPRKARSASPAECPREPTSSMCKSGATGSLWSLRKTTAVFTRNWTFRPAVGMPAWYGRPEQGRSWRRPRCRTSAWAKCSSSPGNRTRPTSARRNCARRPDWWPPSTARGGRQPTTRSPAPRAAAAASCRPLAMRLPSDLRCPSELLPAVSAERVCANGCRRSQVPQSADGSCVCPATRRRRVGEQGRHLSHVLRK